MWCRVASLGYTYMAGVASRTLVPITAITAVILVGSQMAVCLLSIPFRQAVAVCVCHAGHSCQQYAPALFILVFLLIFLNYIYVFSVCM